MSKIGYGQVRTDALDIVAICHFARNSVFSAETVKRLASTQTGVSYIKHELFRQRYQAMTEYAMHLLLSYDLPVAKIAKRIGKPEWYTERLLRNEAIRVYRSLKQTTFTIERSNKCE